MQNQVGSCLVATMVKNTSDGLMAMASLSIHGKATLMLGQGPCLVLVNKTSDGLMATMASLPMASAIVPSSTGHPPGK